MLLNLLLEFVQLFVKFDVLLYLLSQLQIFLFQIELLLFWYWLKQFLLVGKFRSQIC